MGGTVGESSNGTKVAEFEVPKTPKASRIHHIRRCFMITTVIRVRVRVKRLPRACRVSVVDPTRDVAWILTFHVSKGKWGFTLLLVTTMQKR